MSILEALSHLIVITWWTLGIWSIVTGAIWYTWDRRKIRPLERRINRLDYEIEEIEGPDFMRGETPESRALRKARDIDSMALNDEEERIDIFLRKWGFFRVFYRDPYSRSATRFKRERERLQKRLDIVDS